jgi:hypothetical protein
MMERQTELDWLRGLMLVLMTVTHLPTWFSAHAGQPFGFVSAAEGFVFLSAYLVGSVYTRTARVRGFPAMRRALWGRALKVYAAHAALLLFLLVVLLPIATARDAHAITDLASFHTEHPRVALAGGLLLLYNPPLLDILPMYVLFLALSPFALEHAMRRGWGSLLTLGAVLWLLAQVGVPQHVYEAAAALTEWPIPYNQTGAFSFTAWQLLWLIGLRAGMQTSDAPNARRDTPAPTHRAIVAAAVAATLFFVWRHITGQVPFGGDAALNALFDKWHLGPLRLANFAVLAILVVNARPMLAAWGRHSPIAALGRASLTVFSTHVVFCLAALMVVGGAHVHLHVADEALLAAALLALYAAARASLDGGSALRAWRATRLSGRMAR